MSLSVSLYAVCLANNEKKICLIPILFLLKISFFTSPSLLHQGTQHLLEWGSRFPCKQMNKRRRKKKAKHAGMGEEFRVTGGVYEEMS